MGNIQTLPIVAYSNSLPEVTNGDIVTSKLHQPYFTNACPIFNTHKSLIEVPIPQKYNQLRLSQGLSSKMVGSLGKRVPAIGHIKGAIQYSIKDTDEGDKKIQVSKRCTPVVGSVVEAFLIGGASASFATDIQDNIAVDSFVDYRRSDRQVALLTNMIHGHYEAGKIFDFSSAIGQDHLSLNKELQQSLSNKDSKALNKLYRTVRKQLNANKLQQRRQLIPKNSSYQRAIITANNQQKQNVLGIQLEKESYETIKQQNELKDKLIKDQTDIFDIYRSLSESDHSQFLGNGAVSCQAKFNGDTSLLVIEVPLAQIKTLISQIKSLEEGQNQAKINNKQRGINNMIQNNKIRQFFNKYSPEYIQTYQSILSIDNKIERAVKFVQYLQLALKELKSELQNFRHLNRHLQNINIIDLLEFRYQRVGKALQFIAKQGQFAGAVITQYSPNSSLKTSLQESQSLVRVQKACNDLSDYELANTTKIVQVSQMVINLKQNKPIKIIEPIYCGGLPIESLKVSVSARDSTLLKATSKLILRYWRKGLSSQYKDIELTKSGIAKYWRTFEYVSATEPIEHLDSGGVIELLAILGSNEDSQILIKDLRCEVKYGSAQVTIGRINDINSLIVFSWPRVHLNTVTDDIIPLLPTRFQCRNRRVRRIKISFKAKDQGWGNRKGAVFLRIWHPDNVNYDQIDLTKTVYHQYKQYQYEDTEQIHKLQMNSTFQFFGRVGGGGGHQLYVEDIELRVELRNIQSQQYPNKVQWIPQKKSIQFSMQQMVQHSDSTDQLIPLYEDVFECTKNLRRIHVTFRAQDQGWGNRKGRVFCRVRLINGTHYDLDMTNQDVPHNWKNYVYEDTVRAADILTGSVLQFYCRVGGGGGHRILVEQFEALLQFQETEKDEFVERPKQINSIMTYFPINQIQPSKENKDKILPVFKQIVECGDRILLKASISFMANIKSPQLGIRNDQEEDDDEEIQPLTTKDQNAQILLKVFSDTKKPYYIHIGKGITNRWKQYTFQDTRLIRMIQSQSKIQVCYRVTHPETRIAVKNFQMTLYRGDLHSGIERTYHFSAKEEMINLTRAPAKHQLLLKKKFIVEKQIRKVYIEYQASGRGQVFMSIFNKRTGKLTHVNISKGETVGEYKKYIYEWRRQEGQLPQIGDIIQFNYKTQDTKFCLKNIYYSLQYQDTSIVFNSHLHFISDAQGQVLPLYQNRIHCGLNEVKRVIINFVGKDEGKGKVIMRIIHPNGKFQEINIGGDLQEVYKEVSFQTQELSSRIPPNSILEFMCVIGSKIFIRDFKVEVVVGNAPRPERSIFKEGQLVNSQVNIISKIKQISIEVVPIEKIPNTLYLNVLKPDGKSIRNIIKLNPQDFIEKQSAFTAILQNEALNSQVAIGDIVEVAQGGPGDKNSFKRVEMFVEFLPLQVPNHRVITYEFTDAQWTSECEKGSINIVGKGQSIKIASKIVALSASCSWKDSGKGDSTGKLYLVQKDSEGNLKNKIDIFGTVQHNWFNVMARFDSNSPLIKGSEADDEISIERQLGSNGQLYVDNLQVVMIVQE